MASNVAYIFAVLALMTVANADATITDGESGKNPIRRVVSMLQMMTKKIEAEAKKEEELYDKYMCYCKNGADTLGKSIADADTKIPQLQSDIEEAEATKAQLEEELKQHQTDRDAAKEAM